MTCGIRKATLKHRLLGGLVFVAVAMCAGQLGACASPLLGEPTPGVDLRVLVKLVVPSQDATAIAAQATRLAKVPVSYAAQVNGNWHALFLHCADASACDVAIDRLRHAQAYAEVQFDERKRRAVM